ncbi:MAG: hypothetical protein ACAH20_21845 [Methylobacteriaceae bacterium]|jgi:hypothetical protein|uniref:Uncharacterized protein n=1 Tax=Methylorubrum extorquens TaxID=408 RepID=A0AAX3WAT7_METEX|nr:MULTISPECIES: hypothetical protein [Methylobacteriaceae]KQO89625.1 hypothetical protein ASF36_22375 [Methylobacterium sp. Leaf90]KQQ11803.1 hypothetical protein ASF53_16715 [Methylobacterium sp. Leaf123]KQQ21516.1 hypothetical protein ASF56_18360 [Methylobacterium sp. Leaf122]WHQ68547.1 hypothetical protein KEC54_19485 [Methylorubrum extorquens]
MADSPPFRPDTAKDAVEGDGDFLLPICVPKPGLLMGESLAVIVLTTVEGQRVGVPLGMQGLSDLHEVTREALRLMQATDEDTLQ